jgi:hypothetical protein
MNREHTRWPRGQSSTTAAQEYRDGTARCAAAMSIAPPTDTQGARVDPDN